ncbi:unnamed protein product [Pleuronectes platessa]|uniref:Uncharacterized protein n=1 Tax=Pleuronectes platessa TaxID=8262 RepID=A0A9N7U3T9_PLEPL|nr:unnamed protein product [Pleuronectes platessa]
MSRSAIKGSPLGSVFRERGADALIPSLPPRAQVGARKGGIEPGLRALQTPWVRREPVGKIQCVEAIPAACTWPELERLNGKAAQKETGNSKE